MSTPIDDQSETIYIGCQCHVPSHIIKVSYYEWDGDEPELYFCLQADKIHLNFWDRLKMSFWFLIGNESIEWHDVIPDNKDLLNLNRVLTRYLDQRNIYWTRNKNELVQKEKGN